MFDGEEILQKDRRKKSTRETEKITKKGLNKFTLHYLTRYSASTESLRKVLMRRIEVSGQNHWTGVDLGNIWVEALIGECQRFGCLNDNTLARGRVSSLLGKGKSIRSVVLLLRWKCVSQLDIDATIDRVDVSSAI